jgi:tyrosyl-tRNA synthetase
LLEGLDGVQKMSQSLNNYISVREKPDVMFGQLMSIPDSLVTRYGLLAADFDDAGLAELDAAVAAGGPAAGAAKRRMARRVVEMYHGTEAAEAAEGAFDRQFKQHEAPEDVPDASLPSDAVQEGEVNLPRLLADLGLASSRGEARRLIAQGGVRIGGERVAAEEVATELLVGAVLQVGKRRFVRITR